MKEIEEKLNEYMLKMLRTPNATPEILVEGAELEVDWLQAFAEGKIVHNIAKEIGVVGRHADDVKALVRTLLEKYKQLEETAEEALKAPLVHFARGLARRLGQHPQKSQFLAALHAINLSQSLGAWREEKTVQLIMDMLTGKLRRWTVTTERWEELWRGTPEEMAAQKDLIVMRGIGLSCECNHPFPEDPDNGVEYHCACGKRWIAGRMPGGDVVKWSLVARPLLDIRLKI